MSKNQKPEQTPTEEAQGATTEQKSAEIAAEEQAAADKVNQDAGAVQQAAKTKYTVIMRFFSKDKIQYEIGDDVSHLDAERLDSLVNRGLVSKS